MTATKQTNSRLHHVAYACKDVEATYQFYNNKLGFKLVHVENHHHQKGWFRHFFFDLGNGECIAFFDIHGVGEKSDFRTDISVGLGMPVWVNHIAFHIEDLDAFEAKKKELIAAGIQRIFETDHGTFKSLYFLDPNGIMLEFCVTAKKEEFAQTPEEAYRLLTQSPEQFDRKDGKDITKLLN